MKNRIVLTGILVVVLSLLSILIGASAIFAAPPPPPDCNSQTWYLWDDESLRKDDPNGGDYIEVGSSGVIFVSDVAAQGSVTFGPGDWNGNIGLHAGSPNNFTILIEVGSYDGSLFHSEGGPVGTAPSGSFTISASGFTIPDGDYLAVKVYTDDDPDTTIELQTGSGGSWITTPCSDPGYPLPEFSTIILLTAGLCGLGGYILWRRRRELAFAE